jgi:hypothetical protein
LQHRKKILTLDFDGVLHSYTTKWSGAASIPDPPVDGALEFLREAVEKFDVHILSTRSHQPGGISAMNQWCCDWFGVEITKRLTFAEVKPPAHVSLDDRGLTFDGKFPSVQSLLDFVPWIKRR